MLPPLNLSDAKKDFFSPRKTNLRRSTVAAKTPIVSCSVAKSNAGVTPRGVGPSPYFKVDEVLATHSVETTPRAALVASLTLIPREFFVIERNAILPTRQYPQTDYESNFTGEGGSWETIVFPAIAPHTRQQVVYLRQTLEKLREVLIKALSADNACDTPHLSYGSGYQHHQRQKALVEYSKQEARMYSVCFHELIRQVKCICKEQSDLLHEVRERYDSIVNRLADYIQALDQELSYLGERVSKVTDERDNCEKSKTALVRENYRLTQRIRELERHGLEVMHTACYSAADDEEAEEEEWQRQRREIASVNSVISTKKRRDSIAEENLAAARVQTAFHKYQMRKAQHSLALRVEKNVAALDIQRSFRGFRERQKALHQRAVIQTIMKRRKEIAAVQLLQENVRAYLLKRRRSIVARRSALTAVKAISTGSEALQLKPESAEGVVTTTEFPTTETLSQLPSVTEANDELERPQAVPSLVTTDEELLCRILSTSGELITAVDQLRSRVDAIRVNEPTQEASAGVLSAMLESTRYSLQLSIPPAFSATSIEIVPASTAATELLQRAITQARNLMRSLGEVFAEPNTHNATIRPDHTDGNISPEMPFDPAPKLFEPVLGVSTSTTSLIGADAMFDTPVSNDEQLGKNDKALDLPELTEDCTLGNIDDCRQSNDFHLDDSLWRSATYYGPLADRFGNQSQQQQLLSLLSTRENRKQLVQLKQFIADVYETIIGKMRELPVSQFSEEIKLCASLTLSCDEWEQQYNLLVCKAMDVGMFKGRDVPIVPYDLLGICREHFRCQKGLSNLVEEAVSDLLCSIERFAPVDPDVEIFRSFLVGERLYEEFFFHCVCRFFCASTIPGEKDPQGNSVLLTSKQPVLMASTMREILPVTRALQVARVLFRIDDQDAIRKSDDRYIEEGNVVYKRYLPMSGFAQCNEICTSYFSSVEELQSLSNPAPPNPMAGSSTAATHGDLATMARPSNRNQFHSKQYNITTSRSPLVRRLYHTYQRQLPFEAIQTADTLEPSEKWIYFDEFVALLLKYRAEMLNFHRFLHWARELFKLALDRSSLSRSQRINDSVFAATLAPLSVNLTDRDLRNLFANSLRQRHLELLMPERTFTSVVLQLLDSRVISVSKYTPVDRQRRNTSDTLRKLLAEYAPAPDSPRGAAQEDDYAQAWRRLAQWWRARDAEFEDTIESIHRSDGAAGYRRVLRLMQLRNELYDLLMDRKAETLLRAQEVFEELIDGMELRASDDLVVGQRRFSARLEAEQAIDRPADERHGGGDDGREEASSEAERVDEGPWAA